MSRKPFDEDGDEPDVLICRSWLDPVVWVLILNGGEQLRSDFEGPARKRRMQRFVAEEYTPANATSMWWERCNDDVYRARWTMLDSTP